MKKIVFLLTALPLSLVACGDDISDPNPVDGNGSLTIKASLQNIQGQTAEVTDFTGFELTLTNTTSNSYGAAELADGLIEDIPAGTYSATLTNLPSDYTPAFDMPYYGQTRENVTVTKNQNTGTNFVMTLANAGIYFVLDDKLAEFGFDTVSPVVSQDGDELVFEGENADATGFFYPSLVRVSLLNGEENIEIGGTGIRDFTLEAGQIWKLTVSARPTTDGIEVFIAGADEYGTGEDFEWNSDNADVTYTRKSGASNCIIIAPGEHLEFDVAKAYRIWSERVELTTPMEGEESAFLLWQDNPGLIEYVGLADEFSGEENKIRVLTGQGSGNALVAYKVGDDIRWSWHIWVTDYNPDTGTTYTFTSTPRRPATEPSFTNTFMDRNLGALNATPGSIDAFGLHYQWGRKDPFPRAKISPVEDPLLKDFNSQLLYDIRNNSFQEDSIAWVDGRYTYVPRGGLITHEVVDVTDKTEPNNMRNAIVNPTKLFATPDAPYDWLAKDILTFEDNIWNDVDNGNAKTDFDPCPEGWRVPYGALVEGRLPNQQSSVSPYAGMDATTMSIVDGGLMTEIGYVPFAGLRNSASIGFYYVGTHATIWSGMVHKLNGMGNNAQFVSFNVSGGAPVSNGINQLMRGNGMSVRCVKE